MNELHRKRADSDVMATSHDTIVRSKSKVKSKKNPSGTTERLRLNVLEEEEDRIIPRAGGRLVVPREEIEDDHTGGEELDLTSSVVATIGKPGPNDWFRLYRNRELPTKLLLWKRRSDAIGVEYYHVDAKLRTEISNELKAVRVLPYYNLSTDQYGLWIVKVTVGNSWYESLRSLFSESDDFFEDNQIRVFSDKPSAKYRVKHTKLVRFVNEPTHPTDEMLGQALGEDHFIRDRSHPVYQSLIEGEELQ